MFVTVGSANVIEKTWHIAIICIHLEAFSVPFSDTHKHFKQNKFLCQNRNWDRKLKFTNIFTADSIFGVALAIFHIQVTSKVEDKLIIYFWIEIEALMVALSWSSSCLLRPVVYKNGKCDGGVQGMWIRAGENGCEFKRI